MSQQLLISILVAVGLLVGLGILGFFTLRKRKPKGIRVPRDRAEDRDWEDHEYSFANRRASVRRDGLPVQVNLTSPTLRGGRNGGYVLDRSTGGLRVAVTAAIPAGTVLQVRADNAPDTVPWVGILVRSCRDTGPYFELGCEFEKTPPWNILLLFG
jgi:hypothetical protein